MPEPLTTQPLPGAVRTSGMLVRTPNARVRELFRRVGGGGFGNGVTTREVDRGTRGRAVRELRELFVPLAPFVLVVGTGV